MEEPVARTFLGTRGYLSPEQLSRRDYTKAVDTWALGVIVFGKLVLCCWFDDSSLRCSPVSQLILVFLLFQFYYVVASPSTMILLPYRAMSW